MALVASKLPRSILIPTIPHIMPTIPVNGSGAVLYYEDSGSPGTTEDYHTIFIVHGFIFHGGMYHPALRLMYELVLTIPC